MFFGHMRFTPYFYYMKRSALVLIIVLFIVSKSAAQGCSVCTKTVQGLDDKSARGLNGGIVYLAFLPLVMMGTVGVVWWRRQHAEK